jgi:hypothetical protein
MATIPCVHDALRHGACPPPAVPGTVEDSQLLRAAKVGFPVEDYIMVLPGFYELVHVFMQADIIKNPFELAIRNNGRKKTNQEY